MEVMKEATLKSVAVAGLLALAGGALAGCGGDAEPRAATSPTPATSGREAAEPARTSAATDRAPAPDDEREAWHLATPGGEPMTAAEPTATPDPTGEGGDRPAPEATAPQAPTRQAPRTEPAGAREELSLAEEYADVEGTLFGVGEVSYYADHFAGRATASGEPYDPQALTAAIDIDDLELPLGTIVRVERIGTDESVVVRINDRMQVGNEDDRVLDLSRAAAGELGILDRGVTRARIVVLERPSRRRTASR